MQTIPRAVSIHLRRGCARTGAKMLRAFVFKPGERDTPPPQFLSPFPKAPRAQRLTVRVRFLTDSHFLSQAPSIRWTPAVYGTRISVRQAHGPSLSRARPPATDMFVASASSQCSRRLDIAAITECIGKMPMPRLAGRMPALHELRMCTRQIDKFAHESASLCNNKVNKKDESAETPQNPLIFDHAREQTFDPAAPAYCRLPTAFYRFPAAIRSGQRGTPVLHAVIQLSAFGIRHSTFDTRHSKLET